MCSSDLGVVPHAQAGRVKPLGVTGTKRTSVLPDVPTMGEAGVPGFEAPSWMGFFSPAGLPREIQSKIQGDTAKVLQMPDVREKFAREGFEPVGNTPAEFRERFLADWATYARVVKEAKIPPQD